LARIVAERCNGHSAGCVGVISLTLQTLSPIRLINRWVDAYAQSEIGDEEAN
jgi:hypothetical protein